jgi:hypothetical protein
MSISSSAAPLRTIEIKASGPQGGKMPFRRAGQVAMDLGKTDRGLTMAGAHFSPVHFIWGTASREPRTADEWQDARIQGGASRKGAS